MENQNNIKIKPFRQKHKLIDLVIVLSILVGIVFILLMREQKPDPESEKVIREIAASQLNKDPNDLTDDDFAKITELTIAKEQTVQNKDTGEISIFLTSIELYDIKYLKNFTNLRKLDISRITFPYKKIPVWMKFLEERGFSDLHRKILIDLTPLEKLSHIEELKLGGSRIKNIKPLANLSNLKILELSGTRVTNLETIANLAKLQSLTIKYSTVYNVSPIKNLTNLKSLDLIDCKSILYDDIEDLKKALPNLIISHRITPMIRI